MPETDPTQSTEADKKAALRVKARNRVAQMIAAMKQIDAAKQQLLAMLSKDDVADAFADTPDLAALKKAIE